MPSILIEALTVVVKRTSLDVAWPGGTEAFIEHLAASDVQFRYAIRTDSLLAVSAFDPDEIVKVEGMLQERGLVGVDAKAWQEYAVLDQRFGPTMPCDWLEWRRTKQGFTHAWLVGEEHEYMLSPDGWDAEVSRRLTRSDVRDEPDRMIRLADESGLETWLDTMTGQLSQGLPQREEAPNASAADGPPSAEPSESAPIAEATAEGDIDLDAIIRELEADVKAEERKGGGQIARAIQKVLVGRKLAYDRDAESIRLTMRREKAAYALTFRWVERTGVVILWCNYAVMVPEERRPAMAQAIAWANFGIPTVTFEMDQADGELRARAGVDVSHARVSPGLIDDMLGAVIVNADRYHDAFMKVIYAGFDPEQAVAEAEDAS